MKVAVQQPRRSLRRAQIGVDAGRVASEVRIDARLSALEIPPKAEAPIRDAGAGWCRQCRDHGGDDAGENLRRLVVAALERQVDEIDSRFEALEEHGTVGVSQ